MQYVIERDKAPVYVPPGHRNIQDRVLIDKETAGAENLSVWYGFLDPGGVAEAHTHPYNEQVFFVIKGKVQVEINDETYIAETNCAIFIPPNTKHALEALDESTELLVIGSPPLK